MGKQAFSTGFEDQASWGLSVPRCFKWATNVKLDYPKTGSQKVGRKQKTRNGYGSNPSYPSRILRVKEVFEFKGIPLRKPGIHEKATAKA